MRKKFPVGILFFGLYLIAYPSSELIAKLSGSGYYQWYCWLFEPMPEQTIFLRYVLSIFFRIAEIAIGVGLILRMEIFRKAVLLLGVSSIFVFYWKHPLSAVSKHAAETAVSVSQVTGNQDILLPVVIRGIGMASLVCLYVIDIGLGVALIYYFTRPHVKKWFE